MRGVADLEGISQKLALEVSQDHGGAIIAPTGVAVSLVMTRRRKKKKKEAGHPSTSLRTGPDIGAAVRLVADKCPRLRTFCYWAGTSSVATEVLGHRRSMDLDFHTLQALRDVRPILAEAQRVFGRQFRLVETPDVFGSGFRGVLKLPSGSRIGLEVFSNYEDACKSDLEPSSSAPGMRRVSLGRYLADKVQCLVERVEARDLVDILAVIRHTPALRVRLRRLVMAQDAVLLAERLLGWTDRSIRKDLAAYRDVNPMDAVVARNLILEWIGEHRSELSG